MNGIEQIEDTRKRALGSTPFPGQAKSDPTAAIPRQGALFDSGPTPARAHARWSHPGTSFAAAASVKNLRRSQQAILNLLRKHGPATHVELIDLAKREGLRMSESGIRSRCAELVRAGEVFDSGGRKRLPTGRQAIVWAAVQ